jgi:hypothetical protein
VVRPLRRRAGRFCERGRAICDPHRLGRRLRHPRRAADIQFNHAHALGLGEPLGEAALDAVIVALRSNASSAWAVQVPDTPEFAEARERIEAMDLRGSGGWAKFWRAPVPPKRVVCAFDIREVSGDGAVDFGRVVHEGFGAPPPFAGWAGAIVGRPRWRAYVAYDGDKPVAAGALYLRNGLGWLGLGATLPAYRGRGAQNAILARRIGDAVAAGVLGLVTETGRPPPGEEAKHPSYRNIRRAGFEDVYLRLNYRPVDAR